MRMYNTSIAMCVCIGTSSIGVRDGGGWWRGTAVESLRRVPNLYIQQIMSTSRINESKLGTQTYLSPVTN